MTEMEESVFCRLKTNVGLLISKRMKGMGKIDQLTLRAMIGWNLSIQKE